MELLQGDLDEGDTILVDFDGQEFTFRPAPVGEAARIVAS